MVGLCGFIGKRIVVRTNWKPYLSQLLTAWEIAKIKVEGGEMRELGGDETEAVSAFERKFFIAGEKCYEIDVKIHSQGTG